MCTMLGIKAMPDAFTMGSIKRVFNHYHYITPEEFVYAFELNVMGEYQEEVMHFQSFDMPFVTRIIGYYRHRKAESEKEAQNLEQEKQLPQQKSTNEDFYNGLVAYFEKNKEFPVAWNYSAVYEHMKAHDMVTESLEWKQKFKQDIEQRMKDDMVTQKLKSRDALERIKIDDAFTPDSVVARCQREYVIYKISQVKKYLNV